MTDNLALTSIQSPQLELRSPATPRGSDAAAPVNGKSFDSTLKAAIDHVEQAQLEADRQATMQASGAGNLHETAIALEKADISMRLMLKTRNKVVEAYQEIMRMSV